MRVLNSLEVAAVAGGYQAYTDNCGEGYTMVRRTYSSDVSTTTQNAPSSTNASTSQTTILTRVFTVCEETSGSGGGSTSYGSGSTSYGGGIDYSPSVNDEDKVANVMF